MLSKLPTLTLRKVGKALKLLKILGKFVKNLLMLIDGDSIEKKNSPKILAMMVKAAQVAMEVVRVMVKRADPYSSFPKRK